LHPDGRAVVIAARYALQQFTYHNSVTGSEECIVMGAQRDSVTGQAFLESPASFWSAAPLTSGTQIDPKLAAYLVAYPST
jgi:hypothetical protein